MIGCLTSANAQNVNPYDQIGIDHNAGLRYLLPHLNICMDRSTAISVAKPLLQNFFSSSQMGGYDNCTQFESIEESLLYLRNNCSAELNNEVDIVVNYVMNNLSVSSIQTKMDNQINNANNIRNSTEKQNFLAFLAVVKYSAEFWLPLDLGGENGLQYIGASGGCTDTPNLRAIKWYKVILQDALGTVVGGALGGPPGAVAGLVAQSGGEIITQLP